MTGSLFEPMLRKAKRAVAGRSSGGNALDALDDGELGKPTTAHVRLHSHAADRGRVRIIMYVMGAPGRAMCKSEA